MVAGNAPATMAAAEHDGVHGEQEREGEGVGGGVRKHHELTLSVVEGSRKDGEAGRRRNGLGRGGRRRGSPGRWRRLRRSRLDSSGGGG